MEKDCVFRCVLETCNIDKKFSLKFITDKQFLKIITSSKDRKDKLHEKLEKKTRNTIITKIAIPHIHLKSILKST